MKFWFTTVITHRNAKEEELSLINWTLEMDAPIYQFVLCVRGQHLQVNYLNRVVGDVQNYIYQELIPSFYGFSATQKNVNNNEEKEEKEKEKEKVESPLLNESGYALGPYAIINVLLIDSDVNIISSSKENSDGLTISFDTLTLWWERKMVNLPGTFFKNGNMNYVYPSYSVGHNFDWFQDVQKNVVENEEDNQGNECSTENKNGENGENDEDDDEDEDGDDDGVGWNDATEPLDEDHWKIGNKYAKLCLELTNASLSSFYCSDLMTQSLNVTCSVELGHPSIIPVIVNIPTLNLKLSQQEYGAILGLLYGNFGEGIPELFPFVVSPILPNVSKYKSEESVHREWSTVVDIPITLPSFQPISLFLARSPLL